MKQRRKKKIYNKGKKKKGMERREKTEREKNEIGVGREREKKRGER